MECVTTLGEDDRVVLTFDLADRDLARFTVLMTLVLCHQDVPVQDQRSSQEIKASLP
jgi:hypothetical protein